MNVVFHLLIKLLIGFYFPVACFAQWNIVVVIIIFIGANPRNDVTPARFYAFASSMVTFSLPLSSCRIFQRGIIEKVGLESVFQSKHMDPDEQVFVRIQTDEMVADLLSAHVRQAHPVFWSHSWSSSDSLHLSCGIQQFQNFIPQSTPTTCSFRNAVLNHMFVC